MILFSHWMLFLSRPLGFFLLTRGFCCRCDNNCSCPSLLCVFMSVSTVTWRTTRSVWWSEEPFRTSDCWRGCKYAVLTCYLGEKKTHSYERKVFQARKNQPGLQKGVDGIDAHARKYSHKDTKRAYLDETQIHPLHTHAWNLS